MTDMRSIYQIGKAWACCLLILLGFTSFAGAHDSEDLLREAMRLRQEHKESEALALYEKVIELEPRQAEALCQASLLHSRIGAQSLDETTRGHHYKIAGEYAFRAVAARPDRADANFAMAFAYNHLSQITPVRKKMILLRDMKHFLDRALEQNPQHADAWHLLGRWHFRAANYTLSELLMTNMFMRGVSKEASNEKAIEAIQKAIQLDSGKIVYYHDLARIYQETKQTEECHALLKKALELELVTAEELEISRRCKALLRSLKEPSI